MTLGGPLVARGPRVGHPCLRRNGSPLLTYEHVLRGRCAGSLSCQNLVHGEEAEIGMAKAVGMTSFPCVHHIEVGAVDGAEAVNILRSKFCFKVKATRQTEVANQWLVVKNNAKLLVTSLKSQDTKAIKNDSFVVNWTTPALSPDSRTFPSKDSVFNVAFQVKDIDRCMKRLNQEGATFAKAFHTVRDADGSVTTCVVKSCVGDVHHTLIEKSDYAGAFLPGFTPVTDDLELTDDLTADSLLESFDHVTFAVEMNTSMAVIDWYEKCFGMKRFLINREENEQKGLLLSTDDVGLRLRAMEYWKCAEVGLMTRDQDGAENRLSVVIAEGLPPLPGSTEKNQIESWIRQHGGPGIQHIAFTTSDIKATVRKLRQLGTPFANPPPAAYYSEFGRLADIKLAGEDAEELRNSGILIDTEADGIYDSVKSRDDNIKMASYLLQIFTRPVFQNDPFFIEIIDRRGATGFGSGNVAALYRSVQAFLA